jgi:hypothetical protein
MEADFPNDIDRIAQLAAALRELDADLPLAEALEAQVAVLEEAQGQYGPTEQQLRPKLTSKS